MPLHNIYKIHCINWPTNTMHYYMVEIPLTTTTCLIIIRRFLICSWEKEFIHFLFRFAQGLGNRGMSWMTFKDPV